MECENCHREHDGSYGSGRFCSKSCRCSFNAKKQKNYPEKFPTKEQLKLRKGFGAKPKPGGWICQKCGLKFETRVKLYQHNLEVKHPNNQGWAKGLTKETSNIIYKISQKISKTLKEGRLSGRIKTSNEYRKRMSKMKKKFYKEHPEMHPNRKLAGNRKKMTYPEQIVYDWLIQQKIQFEHQFQWQFIGLDKKIHKRFVDFYLPQHQIFIEVDGKYWHQNRLDEDHQKDIQALKDGISTIRIDPSKSIIDQLNMIISL